MLCARLFLSILKLWLHQMLTYTGEMTMAYFLFFFCNSTCKKKFALKILFRGKVPQLLGGGEKGSYPFHHIPIAVILHSTTNFCTNSKHHNNSNNNTTFLWYKIPPNILHFIWFWALASLSMSITSIILMQGVSCQLQWWVDRNIPCIIITAAVDEGSTLLWQLQYEPPSFAGLVVYFVWVFVNKCCLSWYSKWRRKK